MNVSSRKAKNVSIFALILSLVFFIFTLALGAYIQVLSVYLLSWQILAGVLIWIVLLIQFYQQMLAEQEKLDMSQLAKAGQQDTIFASGGDRMAMLAVAQKRLKTFEKWFIPISAVVIGVFQILIGLSSFKYKVFGIIEWDPKNPLLGAVLMVAVSFVSFLVSRYATGMSVEKGWKPLRAGGSYLLLTGVLGFAVAIAQAAAAFKYDQGLVILNYVVPGLLVVLGFEILLNALLDIYRPRVAGQYSRAAFDSRLLGIINEPGGMLHTIAHTIDYQFGFKVSQTWFYKLLGKAILPLVLFAMLTLYLMSCVIVIGPGQAAVIEHFGSPVRTEEAGMHMKWPWPVDVAFVYPTDEIQQLSIGYKEGEEDAGKKAFLWGEKHFEDEYDLLVAVRSEAGMDDQEAVPVSVVQANMPIQYRISDLEKFMYLHKDAGQMLEAICYRELTRFAASANIETDSASGQQSLLGAGRMAAAEELQKRIQKSADEAELGVELVFLGLQGVHPPAEVAKEYEQVVASVQQKQALILNAQAEKIRILTELAGSIEAVDALYSQAMGFEAAKQAGDEAKTQALGQALQTSLDTVKGKVYKTLRDAGSYAFERANLAKGDGLRFDGQLKGYQASPEIFKKLQRLVMLEEALKNVRKYVVVAEKEDSEVYIIDLQEKLTTSLYDDIDMGLEQSN
jgi:regulator of protease activity HflC (stomatin/prohibitin superfamily)